MMNENQQLFTLPKGAKELAQSLSELAEKLQAGLPSVINAPSDVFIMTERETIAAASEGVGKDLQRIGKELIDYAERVRQMAP